MPTRDLKLAGVTIMAVMALCALAGVGIGSLFDSANGGGFLGALIGIPFSMYVGWRLYLKPFSEAMAKRDYSHLTPKVGDDD